MTQPLLADFAAFAGRPDGDYVVRPCPVLFRAGAYRFPPTDDRPDGWEFTMTPDDIRAVIDAGRGATYDIDDAHRPTHRPDGSPAPRSFFEGKLGRIANLRPLAEGDYSGFAADYLCPAAINALSPDKPIRLSATFDPATKALKKVSLTDHPRIPDAGALPAEFSQLTEEAVFTALAEDEARRAEFYSPDQPRDDEGRWTETAGAHGHEKAKTGGRDGRQVYAHESGRAVAVDHKTGAWEHKAASGKTIGKGKGLAALDEHLTRKAGRSADMADFAVHSPHGLSSLQMLHDQAARAGARCPAGGPKGKSAEMAEFTTDAEADAHQSIHDAACQGGAKCRLMDDDDPRVNGMKSVAACYAEHAEFAEAMSPRERALYERARRAEADLEAQRQAAREARFTAELSQARGRARAAARQLFDDGKIVAAEFAGCEGEYLRAVLDDLHHPGEVQFSLDGESFQSGTREDAVKARWAAKPPPAVLGQIRDADADAGDARFALTDRTPQSADAPTKPREAVIEAALKGAGPAGAAALAERAGKR